MFGIDEQQEFLLSLKYTKCNSCQATMFCRFGCMNPEYPQGLRDFSHTRWEEIISIYIKYYQTDSAIHTDILSTHVATVMEELKRRKGND